MTNWKQDLVIAGVFLAMSGTFGYLAVWYPPDARVFPELLCILLGILALCLGGKALMGYRTPACFVEWRYYRGVALQVALIGAFACIISVVGYLAGSFLLCFATAWNAGYPNRKVTLVFSLGVSLFVFAIFRFILEVPLPEGIFFE